MLMSYFLSAFSTRVLQLLQGRLKTLCVCNGSFQQDDLRCLKGGFLSGFQVGKASSSSLYISHLLLADNTLIFCEVRHDHI